MFRKYIQTAIVSRQSYVTESGYKKSLYAPTGNSYTGSLKARSLKSLIDISAFGREYTFHTVATADILESDRLTIDGVTYDVKGVAVFEGITFNVKQCVLSKAENLGT